MREICFKNADFCVFRADHVCSVHAESMDVVFGGNSVLQDKMMQP